MTNDKCEMTNQGVVWQGRPNQQSATMRFQRIHHLAVICSDYQRSKRFYTEVLELQVLREVNRESRRSYRLELSTRAGQFIELFSFPDPPRRPSEPEACGLRHLCFQVDDLDEAVGRLRAHDVIAEPIRIDPETGNRYTFFRDPDNLPIELLEPVRPARHAD
jgi:glyoxylase I family protein